MKLATRPIPLDKAHVRALAVDISRELIKRFGHVGQLKGTTGDHIRGRHHPEPLRRVTFTEVGRDAAASHLGVWLGVAVGDDYHSGRSHREFVQGGFVTSVAVPEEKHQEEGSPRRGDVKKVQLTLVLYNRPVVDFEGLGLQGEVYFILLHEMTHLRDRIYGRDQASARESAPEDYYNRPEEVRAFMAQVVDGALEDAWKYLKTMEGWATVNDLVAHTLGHSVVWGRVGRFFSVKNRKLVQKAVYVVLSEAYLGMMKRYEGMAKRLGLGFDPPEDLIQSKRVAHRWLLARPRQRIRDAIAESMGALPDQVLWDIEAYSRGVILGKAPQLEKHTAVMYRAFAPLRQALGQRVVMYRGEPRNPPGIERKWLSWSTSPLIAAHFSGVTSNHIIEARIAVVDVVAGIVSESNDRYIEYLVLDRPEYHRESPNQVPTYNWVTMGESGVAWPDDLDWEDRSKHQELLEHLYPQWGQWLREVQVVIRHMGGRVLKVREPNFDRDESPLVGYVMPAGVVLPHPYGEWEEVGRAMPEWIGRVG